MELTIEEKDVSIKYVTIDNYSVEYSWLEKVIEKLKSCNGTTKSLSVSDKELELILIENEVIKVSSFGGWYPGKKFKQFTTKLNID